MTKIYTLLSILFLLFTFSGFSQLTVTVAPDAKNEALLEGNKRNIENLSLQHPENSTLLTRKLVKIGVIAELDTTKQNLAKKWLSGKWLLSKVEANSLGGKLDSLQEAKRRLSYLRAAPPKYTSLAFHGNLCTFIHHDNQKTEGTWKIEGNLFSINAKPSEDGIEGKNLHSFVIRSINENYLHLILPEEDSDRQSLHMELIFIKL